MILKIIDTVLAIFVTPSCHGIYPTRTKKMNVGSLRIGLKQELKSLLIGWYAWSNPFSNIVVLKRPPDRLIRRWQLATQGPWSHIVLMPHVREVTIDQFVNELASASFAAIQHNNHTSG